MNISYSVFLEKIDLLLEICSLQKSEKVKVFYYNYIRSCDENDITKAFHIFMTRSKWPSVEEFLKECNKNAPLKKEDNERVKEQIKNDSEIKFHSNEDNSYGLVSFQFRSYQTNEGEATKEFETHIERLQGKGWEIINKNIFSCRLQKISEKGHCSEVLGFSMMLTANRNKVQQLAENGT